MADQRDEVLEYIKYNGPVLPVQISKHINTNILFSSAILSELVDRKLLRITHASIGGSPVYYLQGQEAAMDEKLHKSLGGKEKEAYALIKEIKVAREIDLEPWQRVAIKSLKDFTKPINVTINGNNETYWAYHLVTEEEAKQYISNIIQQIPIEQLEPATKIEEPKTQLEQEIKPTVIPQLIQEEIKEIENNIKHEIKEEVKQQTFTPTQKKETINEKPEGEFYEKIIKELNNNKIKIIKEEQIKKDKEIDFIADFETGLGKLRYLIKAKAKPSIAEADVIKAFSEGQMKNLPVILITNGKVSKKTYSMIENKFAGQIAIKEI